jgi:hypothetical protein
MDIVRYLRVPLQTTVRLRRNKARSLRDRQKDRRTRDEFQQRASWPTPMQDVAHYHKPRCIRPHSEQPVTCEAI